QRLGAFPQDRREPDAERLVDGLKDFARGRKRPGEVLAHPDLLRALPRTEQQRLHHFKTIEPQVNPAPKVTSSTVMPGCSRPARRASSSALGIDAHDVSP